MFKFDMIVDDSFCRLNKPMIVHDSFSASGLVKNGHKPKMAIDVLSSEEEQSHNPDYSDAESEKANPPKKSRKVTHEKWSGGLISKLIDEYEACPCLWNIFCDDYHNRDGTGKAKKELEVSLSQSELHQIHFWLMYYLFAHLRTFSTFIVICKSNGYSFTAMTVLIS